MKAKDSHPITESVDDRGARVPMTAAVEAVGTFILVATAGAAVLSACPLASLGVAVILIVLIYAAGHLAGGQFNAAVTLAMLLRGRIGLRAATMHWLAQVGGGLLAAVVVRMIVDPARNTAGADLVLADHTLLAGSLAELVSAFMLSYAVLGMTASAAPQTAPAADFIIGVGAVVGALAVAALSVGAFDAATAIHELTAGLLSWSTVWVYLVGQIVAGLFAGITFLTFGWWAHFED